MSSTEHILDFAFAPPSLPQCVRDDTERLLGDTLAVGAAGATAPGAQSVLAAAACWGTGSDSRAIGDDCRLPAAGAAFVNGFRIHCLEWDAVHEPAVVHALSTVTAAVGAAIDRRGGCDADEALAAIAVGVDVASGLGLAATSPLSFFRPATAGCIGSALAVARIDGLSRDGFADVLGLAYSSCAGTMQAHVEGSVALPLQIANAARSAVAAVDLVKAGLTGPHDALEGPFGYFQLFDRGDLKAYTGELGNVWRISEVSVKPFPSGRASHGTLGLLQSLGRPCDDIIAIDMFVPPLVERLVGRPMRADMTPSYARLCLPLLSALMLEDGLIDPRRFVPETFADRALGALADRIRIVADDNADPNALSPQRIMLTRGDGSHEEHRIPHTLGSPDAPLDARQARSKFSLCRAVSQPGCDPRVFDDPIAYFTEPK